MWRKRRRPTPNFGIPPPVGPIIGQYASLRPEGVFPYCAMMQVAAEDTYDDYVICRGFDTRIRKFVDYAAGNSNKPGISVAKPYGKRIKGTYQIAQVYPAVLPIQGAPEYTSPSPVDVDWRAGQSPGVTDNPGLGGHPQSLADTIDELKDHNDKYVNWLLLDGGGGSGGNRVAYTENIIYGRDGLTPGGDGAGGPVKVQPLKLDGSPLAFVADGSEVDCYSWVKADSTDPQDEVDDGGKLFIFIEQDEYGIWWFTGQDCPPGADVVEEV